MNEDNKLTVNVYFADPFATDVPGSGNPAAVVVLEGPISDSQKSYISSRLAQPETVFISQKNAGLWSIDWFTPVGLRICPGGNGTIAAAQVILTLLEKNSKEIQLEGPVPGLGSMGFLSEDRVSVTLPSVATDEVTPWYRNRIIEAFGDGPILFRAGKQDLIGIYEDETAVRSIRPQFWNLNDSPYLAYIATARGDRGGFVYRTFIGDANSGWECPGSARALMNLVNYWEPKVSGASNEIPVEQLSARGGYATCRIIDYGDRGRDVLVTTKCPVIAGPCVFNFSSIDDGDQFNSLPFGGKWI